MRKWQDGLAPHGLGVHSSTDGSEEGRGGGRGGGRLTSNAGALTSMWLTTWSSRFTLWSGTLGRSKTALTQYWILPYFPVNEVTKGLKRTKEVNWEVHLSVKHYWKSTLKVLVWVKKKKKIRRMWTGEVCEGLFKFNGIAEFQRYSAASPRDWPLLGTGVLQRKKIIKVVSFHLLRWKLKAKWKFMFSRL